MPSTCQITICDLAIVYMPSSQTRLPEKLQLLGIKVILEFGLYCVVLFQNIACGNFCFGNLHIVSTCLVATKVIKPDSNMHILLPSRHIYPQLKGKT